MKKYFSLIGILVVLFVAGLSLGNSGCGSNGEATSDSGVKKAHVTVQTDVDGNTVEQKNIAGRLENDNKIGSIKHLYIISPYSGQVILYSTVRGKVTSSGKRLTPNTVDGGSTVSDVPFNYVHIGGSKYITNEVIQDDGTYGSSEPYIYWWDARGIYHQHFFTGGQIIHISDQPLPVSSVTINLEKR